MDKKEDSDKPAYKKWWFWMVIVLLIAAVGGAGMSSNKNNNGDSDGAATAEEETKYDDMDMLRKCTVMEAADIYTTGIGGDGGNVFDAAKKTCESWRTDWGDSEFYEAVTTDWENRKSEAIEGNTLEHYLEALGW